VAYLMTTKKIGLLVIKNQIVLLGYKLKEVVGCVSRYLRCMSLEDLSSETVRKNWTIYKDHVDTSSHFYELLWCNLETKMGIQPDHFYWNLLKKFVKEEVISPQTIENRICIEFENEQKTLVIKGMDSDERKELHRLCDQIGLHHETKSHPKSKHKRFLYIYRPAVWQWEYTERNPYSKSDEFYTQMAELKKRRIQRAEERLRRKYCYGCDKNGLETQLFCSVYLSELYCEDCLEYESDGDGGKLGDHKFEPI